MLYRVERPPSRSTKPVSLQLIGDFQLGIGGRQLVFPHSVERVLAYVALADRPVLRTTLAGALWIDVTEERAASSLSTALWRLHRSKHRVVVLQDDRLTIAPEVRVDVHEVAGVMRCLLDRPDADGLDRLPMLYDGAGLLPGWDDEWIIAERERFRLLRLEALDRAAEALLSIGQPARALEAALMASSAEPLRESARRLLIRVHVAEGNYAEALRAFHEYRELVVEEIGVEPSPAMYELVETLGVDGARRATSPTQALFVQA